VQHDARRRSHLRLRLTTLDAAGRRVTARNLRAAVRRVRDTGMRATIRRDDLRLRPGRYRWQGRSEWSDAQACSTPEACRDVVPDSGWARARVAPQRLVGCEFRGARQVSRASGSPREVALTFDDGPSAYTPRVLRILNRERVHATFFLVGQAVQRRPELVRQMLREGHMVANHSLKHADLGAGGSRAAYELRRTQGIIRSATDFTPCLFRPPYGSTSAALVRQAGAQRLTTVLWDVDPRDWSLPGAGAIQGRIKSQARRGSIVLMHDGGGPRGQTVAALPRVIHALKRRHYRFVTVTDMLGLAPLLR
jgi:peptidoglycan/xylan/chitin deacetylase (PgdA/CDA1 family)